MLFIGDVHITSLIADNLIDELRDAVMWSDEESVIFVGDYVYHFAYDRKSLLAFFWLLIELHSAGKTIYVLAGNHDRLSWHFVYEEAEKLTKMFGDGLQFITEPGFGEVDGVPVYWLPYNPQLRYSWSSQLYTELLASSHKGEKLSGHVNALLHDALDEWESENSDVSSMKQEGQDLLVIHHSVSYTHLTLPTTSRV